MLRRLVLAIMLGLLLGAASNPPSPSGGNTQTQSQTASAKHHTDAQNAQSNPHPPFVVEIEQPANQHPIATEAEDYRQWYATPDWWVAGFTCALFLATAGLWLFTGLMWWETRKTVSMAIKRPWLFISGVCDLFERNVEDDVWTDVDYAVVNHGEAPAIIESVQCQFLFTDGREETPITVDQNHPLIVNPIIGPGEARQSIPHLVPSGLLSDSRIVYVFGNQRGFMAPQNRSGYDFIFLVKIKYRGISSRNHESSALWRWNYGVSHFEAFGGEKENYAK